jgi:hypothetical protein
MQLRSHWTSRMLQHVWDHFACGTSCAGLALCLYEPEGMHFFLVTREWGKNVRERQNMTENKFRQIRVLRNLFATEIEWPVLDLRFSQWWLWRMWLSAACCSVVWVQPVILKDHIPCVFRVKELSQTRETSSKQSSPPKQWPLSGGHSSPEHCPLRMVFGLRCFWGWK